MLPAISKFKARDTAIKCNTTLHYNLRSMENLSKDLPLTPQALMPDLKSEITPEANDASDSHNMDNGPPFTERYPSEPQAKSALSSLPARAYLDETVTPTLLEGMQVLIAQRPADPLQYLGQFLIDRSNQLRSEQRQTPLTSHTLGQQMQDEKMY